MIHRGLVFWSVAAVATAVGLFTVKYKVQDLEERIDRTNHKIVESQQATHILRVEWAHLNEAERIEKTGSAWRVLTAKGPIACREVVIATNGYTGDLTPKLKMRVVPVASHIIATEELPMPATELIPLQRSIGDTKRVLTYYRPSPDGKHMIFGGRARFTAAPPEPRAARSARIAGVLAQASGERPELESALTAAPASRRPGARSGSASCSRRRLEWRVAGEITKNGASHHLRLRN